MAIDLTFLGTGSAYPSPHRGASSIVMRTPVGTWMFDCGEGTQTQLMRSPVRPGKLTKIFISHLHGDHMFGLPGLVCTVSMNSPEGRPPIDVYGPKGLRRFLRTALELSRSILGFEYRVHELVHDIQPKEVTDWKPDHEAVGPLHCSELAGEDIHPNKDGVWHICKDGPFTVKAAPLEHRIASFGYVITEDDHTGKLDVAVAKEYGLTPGPLFGKLKSGQSVTAPNGITVTPDMVLQPDVPGRKIVILGDTCDNTLIAPLCTHADVLVHEATNEDKHEVAAKENGHSTPGMAGKFARAVNAKRLILTHFSQRYKAEDEVAMTNICTQSKSAFSSSEVICAHDLLQISVPAGRV